MQRGPQRFAT